MDLKSLFAFAVPAHFFRSKGPSRVMRLIAVLSAGYGAYQALFGFITQAPITSYDAAPFFLMASIPLCLLARIIEDQHARYSAIMNEAEAERVLERSINA